MSAADRIPGSARPALLTLLLLAGFAAALLARVLIGSPDVSRSAPAGWVFGLALGVLAFSCRPSAAFSTRAVAYGLAGVVVLCLPVVIQRLVEGDPAARPQGSYAAWALTITVVAVAQEAFLRGALYDAASAWLGSLGSGPTIALSTACFALLHVPLYGWASVPLNLAVGLLLCALRLATGGWAAPAVTHVGADLAAWWLR